MAKLIYGMIVSLDGYVEDAQGRFDWGAPDNDALHAFINELAAPVGLYLYGRKMYEVMLYWETAHTLPDQPPVVLAWARQWQAAEKIVFSRTLAAPASARTRIERAFDPERVRRLKADSPHDITVNGPELAAQVIRAGLVDEFQLIVCPLLVGGGKRFFPEGVRLDLQLLEERRFANGVVALRYGLHS